MHKITKTSLLVALSLSLSALSGCNQPSEKTNADTSVVKTETAAVKQTKITRDWVSAEAAARADIYVKVDLTSDISGYSDNQKQMLKLLIQASRIMDKLYWLQSYGDKQSLLSSISNDKARYFADINYGPWDRLNGDKPFLTHTGEKPSGAQFYPADMTKAEFEAWDQPEKDGLYSLVKRNDKGNLYLLPFHIAYATELQKAADLLIEAAKSADDKSFANYLNMRAKALVSDDFQASDFAWMDMKTNPIEMVIGPIETYEDQLFGYRAAYEAYVLLKDLSWSKKLAKYASYLPELQKGLPVPDKYKQETPGTDSDLNAYDVIYYAGHSNAGAKTIAINLPNDEQVQLKKGTRRLQLKNAMRAKFNKILVPIADVLIAENQRKHIQFYAFFANTMFHEVAHGLGIKNVLGSNNTVRQTLKENASAFEEGKADVLGLYMVTSLYKKGVLKEGELKDYYTTFLASIFRSVRFGASDAHGKANMVRFNYFEEKGAFSYDTEKGVYSVNFDNFEKAMTDLSHDLLTIQGNGDYAKATKWLKTKGVISAQLQKGLDKLSAAGIPVDVVFNQGVKVLGL